ncbi:hypothetical protein GCM10010249_44340 [Streptomyces roseolilacinus]|uniref:Uncharacterized protein n=1 Tax=Streptomyces roseolilacinus TaxID=66904 RepID=A0A918ENN4_9ACTN|nr:hypothetical protein GCM10010249_44340 [Streptomyces roseolilacinus]
MQNPSVRPGRSPRARPTGAPQSEREQNRRRSGTSGRSITADRGSGRGTAGTATRPAPSRPRVERPLEEPELRTDTNRAVAGPDRSCDSRPDTDRREPDEPDERAEGPDGRAAPGPGAAPDDAPAAAPGPAAGRPPPTTPVGGDDTAPSGATTGARPHVSQYSSPPPTSS